MMTPLKIAAGTVIGGQYQVDRRIGAGAMGEVWAGHRLSDGRPVALKVLLAVATGDGEALARFRREAQILARVRSEYVSQVLDFLTDEELGMTLIMELVPGESLHVVLWREKKLSLEVMLPWAADILHGLRDLHACGVIHRDLKPGNIIARPMPGNRPRATLIDFGVGRVITGAGEEELTRITRGDRVLGTLEYMAPEQILGSGTVTGTADLYALGALVFRAVAGHHVFGNAEEGKLALAKLNQDPPPLPLGRQDAIAAETRAFVSRLLARRTRERFESSEQALAVCEALVARLLGHEPARGGDIEDAETMLFDASALVRQAEQRARALAAEQAAPRAAEPSRSPDRGVTPPAAIAAAQRASATPRTAAAGLTPAAGARRPPMQTMPTVIRGPVVDDAARHVGAARQRSAPGARAPVVHEWIDEPTVERAPSPTARGPTPTPTPTPTRERVTPTPPSGTAAAAAGPSPPPPSDATPSVAAPTPRRRRGRQALLLLGVLVGVVAGGWVGASYRAEGRAYQLITEWRTRLLGGTPVAEAPTGEAAVASTASAAASADATTNEAADAAASAAIASAEPPMSAEPIESAEPTAVAVAPAPPPPRRRPPKPPTTASATPAAAAATATTTSTAPAATTAPASSPTSPPATTPAPTPPAPTYAMPTEL